MEKSQISIASFVLNQFDLNPKIGTTELVDKVQEAAKKGKLRLKVTKFSPTHVAWYRSEIRKGIYSERVKSQTLKAMKLGEPQKAIKVKEAVKS